LRKVESEMKAKEQALAKFQAETKAKAEAV
jgi:hypothetical protein